MTGTDGEDGLLAEVRGFGVASANAVIERYVTHARRALSEESSGGPMDPLAEALRALVPFGQSTVDLPDTRSGASCTAVLWLHNPAQRDRAGLRVRFSPLIGCEGGTLDPIPAPDEFRADVPGAGRAPVSLRIDVPAEQEPGLYLGVAVVTGSRDPLTLRLQVRT